MAESIPFFGRKPEVLAAAVAACPDKDCAVNTMMLDYSQAKKAFGYGLWAAGAAGFVGCFAILVLSTRAVK